MAIEKLNKGEFLAFPGMTTNLQPQHVMASKFCKQFSIGGSTKRGKLGSRKKARTTAREFTTAEGKDHRNFVWVPWLPKGVNYGPTQGKDALSGPFSGCYFVRYKIAGEGVWNAAHIATESDGLPDGREIWNDFVEANNVEISSGFKPSPGPDRSDVNNVWVGLITNTDDLYRIEAGPTIADTHPMLRKILTVEKVESLPPDDLRNIQRAT